jgi:lon-related putative ATP-dependent protease
MREAFELKSCDLRYFCDHEIFTFKSTAEIEPLDEVIGQKRAVQAIEFGLNMKNPEYNIFVTGIEGTGKSTITTDIARKYAKTLPTPHDCCMVNNFQDPYRPKPLMVPAGKGSILSRQMDRLIQSLKSKIPKAFEDTAYQKKIAMLHDTYREQEAERFSTLEQNAKEKKLAINKTEARLQTIPLKNGKPLTQETFLKLSKKEQEQIETTVQEFQGEIETALRDLSKIRQEQGKAVEALMSEIALSVVSEQMEFILETYDDCPEIKTYLEEVREHIVANANDFLPRREPDERPQTVLFPEAVPAFHQYKVNVLVDRRDTPGAPVIFESNPTYQNVFGHIEKKPHMGGMTTDFTMIKTGSFLQADGGFLIMEIESLLMYPVVWESLKRALRSKRIVIEDMPAGQGIAASSLRPQSIPSDVKVLLLGGYEPFQALQNYDPKFNKIFKVRADFDYEVERTDKTIQQYAKFVARVCQTETLLPFSPQGVAALVEFGDKIASNKNKLSLRFGAIVGIVKEADYWARKENAMLVSEKHVIKAFNEHRFRYNLYEEKIHESYSDGTVLIDVEGAVVGQVNGLAVHQIGDISFGRPSRITAETFMGKKGLVNIEREANLSGSAHDKGVLTLSGYLGRTFAQNQPLNLSISLTFEQNYNEVDGDSAASTELYAILSSLSGCPIDQGIAVTGSVNQKGKVQAIGGVNQKIEGFFDVCKTKGLTGHQGVLIPVANVKNLMLKKEVVNAVEEGNFHIYQVATIEEGIQILTGTPVGTPDDSGHYPDDTLYGKVEKRLKKYLDRERMFWRDTKPWEDAPGKGTGS